MDWTRGRTVGCGSTASVSVATHSRSREVFAVKSVEVSRSVFLQREQRIVSSLSSCCPWIVSYRGCEVTDEDDGERVFNLFMEYLPRGSLADAIKNRGGKLDEPTISRYTRQILEGLDYLHSQGVVHCDIKSHNILIGDHGGAKIADFGCAKRVDLAEETASAGTISGTPMFLAPEVARGEDQGFAGDVWAMGCTVIEMATGKSPWPSAAADPASLLYRIAYSGKSPAIPDCLSIQARDFLNKCLRRDPEERWSAGQLLEHPFVKNCDFSADQVQESNSKSPTSILDQEFWDAIEESESEATSSSGGDAALLQSAVARIKSLSSRGGRTRPDSSWPSSSSSWWGDDDQIEGWVNVRSFEAIDERVEGGSSQMASVSHDDEREELEMESGGGVVGGEEWVGSLVLGGNVGGAICDNLCGGDDDDAVVSSNSSSNLNFERHQRGLLNQLVSRFP